MVGVALGFFAMPPSVNYAVGAMLGEMLNPVTLGEYFPMYPIPPDPRFHPMPPDPKETLVFPMPSDPRVTKPDPC